MVDRSDDKGSVNAPSQLASDPEMVRRVGGLRASHEGAVCVYHIISGYAARLAEGLE